MGACSQGSGPMNRRRVEVTALPPHIHPLRFLSQALAKDVIAHAYLFSGPRAGHYARLGARLLLCRSPGERDGLLFPCGTCTGCTKAEKGIHPDMNVVEPDGVAIKIGQIRDLQRAISFPPLEGARRVCLLGDARSMTPEASNALLKTLEEPPSHTHLMLVTASTRGLLPTILSRCQLIKCPPPTPEEFLSALPGRPQASRLLSFISGGDMEKARDIDLELVDEIRQGILSLRSSPRPVPDVLRLSDLVSGDRHATLVFIRIMKTILRDVLVARHHLLKAMDPGRGPEAWGDLLVNQDLVDQVTEIATGLGTKALDALAETLDGAEALVERNINRGFLVTAILLNWTEGNG